MLFDRLLDLFKMEDPSQYEDYFEDVTWKTFRLDESIWNESPSKRPKIAYYRELQWCYKQLLEEMSDSFLYDVEEIKRKFNEMHIRNCELEKKLAIEEGNNQILQRQLEDALKWQTVQGRKNEVLNSRGLELIKPAEPNKESNKFTSRSGATKQENQMLVASYFENNWDLEEIAEQLKISPDVVKVYLSTIRKHYRVEFVGGRKHIIFDSDYGNTDWDLAFYARLSEKYTETVAVNS